MITIAAEKDEITAALMRLSRGLSDTTPLMQDIGQYLLVDARDRFSKESAPDGSAWAPRSPVTIKEYQRQGSPWGRILQKEGGLLGSLATQAGNGFVEIFLNQPYAAMMHFGGSRSSYPNLWGDIPGRPILGFEEPQMAVIVGIFEEYLESLIE